jgi:diamine N-acetyltransferase
VEALFLGRRVHRRLLPSTPRYALADVIIRRASPDDATAISELAALVQKLHVDNDPQSYKPPEPGATVAWIHKQLSDPDTVAFMAEDDDGRALGYIITFFRSAEENAVKRRAEFVELNEIGVADEHRSKGIGRALHERVVEHWTAAGATEIRLTVMAFNSNAREYYEHLGFAETARRMRLRLPDPGA